MPDGLGWPVRGETLQPLASARDGPQAQSYALAASFPGFCPCASPVAPPSRLALCLPALKAPSRESRPLTTWTGRPGPEQAWSQGRLRSHAPPVLPHSPLRQLQRLSLQAPDQGLEQQPHRGLVAMVLAGESWAGAFCAGECWLRGRRIRDLRHGVSRRCPGASFGNRAVWWAWCPANDG